MPITNSPGFNTAAGKPRAFAQKILTQGPTDLVVQLGVQVAAVYATSFLSTYLVRELDTSRQKSLQQRMELRVHHDVIVDDLHPVVYADPRSRIAAEGSKLQRRSRRLVDRIDDGAVVL